MVDAELTWIACPAPPGEGGMGQIHAALVRDAQTLGEVVRWQARARGSGQTPGLGIGWVPRVLGLSPLRRSRRWCSSLEGLSFDHALARRLGPGRRFVGFNGTALQSMRQARRLGFQRVELISATLHVEQVWESQRRARADSGGDPGWLGPLERRRTLREYAEADLIHVISPLALEGFVARGVDRDRLRLLALDADPRFRSAARVPPCDSVLRVVYTGEVSALKGIHVLRQALEALPGRSLELTVVGGTGSRFMRRWVEDWRRREPRVRLAPGDPLPALQRATVYVHPSYSDGFGLAAVEALRLGIPVIVSADTGMRHLVEDGVNGWVVPTGDPRALVARLEEVARGEATVGKEC